MQRIFHMDELVRSTSDT